MGSLTFNEIMTGILALASAIVLLSNAGAAIVKAHKAAKAPNKKQDDRLNELEDRMDEHERWRKSVDRKLESDHDSNRVTHQALIALLDHGLYGNNIDQMEDAKNELKKYLTER